LSKIHGNSRGRVGFVWLKEKTASGGGNKGKYRAEPSQDRGRGHAKNQVGRTGGSKNGKNGKILGFCKKWWVGTPSLQVPNNPRRKRAPDERIKKLLHF